MKKIMHVCYAQQMFRCRKALKKTTHEWKTNSRENTTTTIIVQKSHITWSTVLKLESKERKYILLNHFDKNIFYDKIMPFSQSHATKYMNYLEGHFVLLKSMDWMRMISFSKLSRKWKKIKINFNELLLQQWSHIDVRRWPGFHSLKACIPIAINKSNNKIWKTKQNYMKKKNPFWQ